MALWGDAGGAPPTYVGRMLAQLREEVATRLARHQHCLLSTGGSPGVWAIPVRCRSTGLDVECAVPRWSDPTHHLSDDPEVLLVFPDRGAPAGAWLQYRGRSAPVPSPDWRQLLPESIDRPEERYLVVRVTPDRIDVVDESSGWGIRDSIEIHDRERNQP